MIHNLEGQIKSFFVKFLIITFSTWSIWGLNLTNWRNYDLVSEYHFSKYRCSCMDFISVFFCLKTVLSSSDRTYLQLLSLFFSNFTIYVSFHYVILVLFYGKYLLWLYFICIQLHFANCNKENPKYSNCKSRLVMYAEFFSINTSRCK